MENNPHKKMDDFLKDAFRNYEVSYNPGDWLDMEKKLDLFEKGKSNWFKKSSIYSKLFAGALIISIAAVIVFYQYRHSDENSGYNNKSIKKLKQGDNTVPEVLFNTSPPKADSESQHSKNTAITGNKPGSPSNYNKDEVYTKNLSGDSNAAMPVDRNNNIITSYSNKEPVNNNAAKPEVPWLGMLRGVYVEKNRQFPVPTALFTTNITKGCKPLIVEFQADNTDVPKTYLWSFGDGYYSNEPNPKHLYEQNGFYDITLTVTSLMDGKTGTNTFKNKITVYTPPQAMFDWDRREPTIINRSINFIDQSKDAVQWLWDFGDSETSVEQYPEHTYSSNGTYKVELIVKNAFGCYDTAYSYITITGKIKNEDVYAPSAFSPNGDGINDDFRPIAIGLSENEFEMSIHDRNGRLIYETTNINEPWDGKINGNKTAQEGIYIWLVIIKDKYGKQYKYVGHVTLLK